MRDDDCQKVLHDTIVRFAEEFDIESDSSELRLYACATCIESTISTWTAMWEDHSATTVQLLWFFDQNFKFCLQAWRDESNRLSNEIRSESSTFVSGLHSLALEIETDVASEALFDQSVMRALVAAMVARQAFTRGVLIESCSQKDFVNFSPSIHSSFFQKCLTRSQLKLQPRMSLQQTASLLFATQMNQDDHAS
jgi:hypothetical protein